MSVEKFCLHLWFLELPLFGTSEIFQCEDSDIKHPFRSQSVYFKQIFRSSLLNSGPILPIQRPLWSAWRDRDSPICTHALRSQHELDLGSPWSKVRLSCSCCRRDFQKRGTEMLLLWGGKHGTSKRTCMKFYCPLVDEGLPLTLHWRPKAWKH
jgi:hypothetical protein